MGGREVRYLSLFSGIGGFELGIGDKHECIGYSEIDKYAIEIYEKHFSHKNYGDATRIDTKLLPDFDLLVGGFPCQAFSIAGKRKGFEDTRGTLFFEIARILKDKRPGYLVLENVKGLLHHDQGKTFQTILGILSDLGYIVEWQVLNSKNFGVPQNRERVFIVGYLRGSSRPKVFPVGKINEVFREKNGGQQEQQQRIRSEISSTIDLRYGALRNAGETYIQESKLLELTKNVSDAQRIYDINGIGKTLKGLGGGMGAKTGLYMIHNLQIRSPDRPSIKKNKNAGGSGHLQKLDTATYTVDTANGQGIEVGTRIRRLTPTECERLQGFPDGWTEGLSDTQRYKTLGNAVTVNVIEYIFRNFL